MIVLNFHGVGPVSRDMDPGERDCWLDADHFKAILDHVAGDDRVRLTFDDGNASDHDVVLPALVERGMSAVFFVCSGRLDRPGFLTRIKVRSLKAHGMEIGSHGVDHVPWRYLDSAALEIELRYSRQCLSDICGAPVDKAACPFGSYDSRVLRALRKFGYQSVMTSDGGPCAVQDRMVARNTVRRSWTLADIDRLLAMDSHPGSRLVCGIRTSVKRMRPAPIRVCFPFASGH
jgi:peptidoglycan/xylan/chitin deacetylase (PgdA/CDA1 family)